MLRVVQFKTKTPIDCGCLPSAVRFCIPAALAADDVLQTDTIAILEGTLVACFGNCASTNICGQTITYHIQYDDIQLASYDEELELASEPLVCGQVLGVFCEDCFFDYVTAKVDSLAISVLDTSSVNLTLAAGVLSAAVIISPDAGNELTQNPNGLFVPPADTITVSDTDTVDLTYVAGNLSADVIVDPDVTNELVANPTGLFVPPPPAAPVQSVDDTDSVDLTLLAGVLTADVILDPDVSNALVLNPAGLYVAPGSVDISADDANILVAHVDGLYVPAMWIPMPELTYVSATSATAAGDWTALIPIGAKVRLQQGAGYKYFYIIATSFGGGNTTFTLTGGSDYTLVNAAITDADYSAHECPVGHPIWFAYTPTFTGFSAAPASPVCTFMIKGRGVFVNVRMPNGGTSDATTFTMSAPVTAATRANAFWGNHCWTGTDNGATMNPPPVAHITSAASTITLAKTGGSWTAANSKRADFQLFYEI